MIHFQDPGSRSRRSFLRVGSLGLGGMALGLPDFMRAAQTHPGLLRDRSVVFLFMHGGPSQTETFDPKMDMPAEIRSVTGEIPTTLPGVTFGGTFPRLARLAHRMAVVRSFTTGDGNHDIKPIVGKNSLGANMGSLYTRIAGTTVPESGLPRNVALFPQSVDGACLPAVQQFGNFSSTGKIGSGFAPFAPGAGGQLQGDMTLRLTRQRLLERRGLLDQLDQVKRHLDSGALAGTDEFQGQAFDTLLAGIADAFDLAKEDPRTLARYDTAPLVNPAGIRTVWKNHERYRDHSQTLGKLMLLARRLCERGCGFVTVTTNFVWDMHADVNNATVSEGMDYVGRPFDHAVSAFIEDVEARGLSDKILLVCCGEMGRTPKLNKKGGRDHWGRLAPLLIHGGGLRMGQVIGQSTRDGGEPASDPIGMDSLTATILQRLIDPSQARLMDGLPPELLTTLSGAAPIRQLL